jgi:hypothetical protein
MSLKDIAVARMLGASMLPREFPPVQAAFMVLPSLQLEQYACWLRLAHLHVDNQLPTNMATSCNKSDARSSSAGHQGKSGLQQTGTSSSSSST